MSLVLRILFFSYLQTFLEYPLLILHNAFLVFFFDIATVKVDALDISQFIVYPPPPLLFFLFKGCCLLISLYQGQYEFSRTAEEYDSTNIFGFYYLSMYYLCWFRPGWIYPLSCCLIIHIYCTFHRQHQQKPIVQTKPSERDV